MTPGRSGKLRRFHGRTVAEAMQRLKQALGGDAIIVSVKKGRRRFLGLFGSRLIEIMASADNGQTKVYRRPDSGRLSARRNKLKRKTALPPAAELEAATPSATLSSIPAQLAARATTRRLRRELEGIKHLAMDLILQGKESQLDDLPQAWREWYQLLQQIGINRETAQSVILRLTQQPELYESGPDQVGAQVRKLVLDLVPLAAEIALPPEGEQQVVALVGPPGVGKTTTLMKLAAQLARNHRGQIGLLSLATHRIGAAESLESCAQMIGVPFQAAAGRDEIGICLSSLADLPLLLVDTPGCSPNNEAAIEALEGLTQGLGTTTFHLTLSASDSLTVLKRTIQSYANFAPSSVIVTKLDESLTPGMLIELSELLPGGVSHLSMGQTIPGDLLPASREAVERLLFLPADAQGV